jgi:hypothetical protein
MSPDNVNTQQLSTAVASTIAAAVTEQGTAAREIACNVQQACKGATEVAGNIVSVNRGAGETGSASAQVLAAAQLLAGESTHLKTDVQKFLQMVRAASKETQSVPQERAEQRRGVSLSRGPAPRARRARLRVRHERRHARPRSLRSGPIRCDRR